MKTWFSVIQVGFLRQETEAVIRHRVDVGELSLVGASRDPGSGRPIRIDPESVRKSFPADSLYLLRRKGFDAIRKGTFEVPPPAKRYGPPQPLDLLKGVDGKPSGKKAPRPGPSNDPTHVSESPVDSPKDDTDPDQTTKED